MIPDGKPGAGIIIKEMGLRRVKRCYTGGTRGWKSDVPQIRFDVSKLAKLGWHAKHTSDEAVRVAARAVIAAVRRESGKAKPTQARRSRKRTRRS